MNFIKRIYKNKKRYSGFVFAMVLVSFLFGFSAMAGAVEWFQGHMLDMLSGVVYAIVKLIGSLIGLFLSIFMEMAEYSDFIGNNAENPDFHPVTVGWEIIRDLCNMGFVIILLIISIGSILQIETYNYRRWLPRLVIMAVLINFSKMFTGIIIDISQIVMFTFLSGIKNLTSGNIFDALKIKDFLNINVSEKLKDAKGSEVSALNLMITILLALIVSLVALVVIVAMTVIIVIRIVALWILVILSPLAYLFSASPIGAKYASQWWQKFSQWVTVGPVMLFFIWLSFFSLKATMGDVLGTINENPTVGLASIGSVGVMGAFLMAIIMLMASLMVAQQVGGLAARVAGGAYSRIIRTGAWAGAKFTGYRAVRDRYRAYQGERERRRKEAAMRSASRIRGAAGVALAPVRGLGRDMRSALTLGRDEKSKKLSKKAARKRVMANLSDKELEERYEKKQWDRRESQIKQLESEKKGAGGSRREEINKEIGKIKGEQKLGFSPDEERERLKKEAGELEVRSQKGVWAGKVVPALTGKFERAGLKDLKYAQDYKYTETRKEMDAMRDMDEEDLRAKSMDTSATSFERRAADVIALQKGFYKGDEMKEVRDRIAKTNDKKTLSVADAYIEKKRPDLIPGLSPEQKEEKFRDLITRGGDMTGVEPEVLSSEGGRYAKILAKHGSKKQHDILSKAQKEQFRKGTDAQIEAFSEANIDKVNETFEEGYRKSMESHVRHGGDASKAFQFDKEKGEFNNDIARKSFIETIKKGNAVDVVGNIKADDIKGDVSKSILSEVSASQLRTMAKKANKEEDRDKQKTVKEIVRRVHAEGGGELYDMLTREKTGDLADHKGEEWKKPASAKPEAGKKEEEKKEDKSEEEKIEDKLKKEIEEFKEKKSKKEKED